MSGRVFILNEFNGHVIKFLKSYSKDKLSQGPSWVKVKVEIQVKIKGAWSVLPDTFIILVFER